VSCGTATDEASYVHPLTTLVGLVILLLKFDDFP
jgi:hypothetical protein